MKKEQLGFSWLEYLVDLGGLERRRRAEEDKRLVLCYHFLIIEFGQKTLATSLRCYLD